MESYTELEEALLSTLQSYDVDKQDVTEALNDLIDKFERIGNE